ncbi:MAG TPA: FG-GAP-like repeat-containing protein, partial [Balneolaceae bacterium]|nr:FG-GAP-like repeat-containing protein [Balneolaceae bacterium]
DLDTQLGLDQTDMPNGRMHTGSGIQRYPLLKLSNKVYRNNHDLTFSNKSTSWGFDKKDVSQGMAFADLDNDGDLDLVVSRMNEAALIYENTGTNSRIAVRLKEDSPNTQAIGATITLKGGPVEQRKEIIAGGNYLSGSDPLAVFAANPENPDHIITIRWPDGSHTEIDSVKANRMYEIRKLDNSVKTNSTADDREGKTVFEDASGRLNHRHFESTFNDFKLQPLLPYKLSQLGPGVSWIDYDQDGDDDLFIGSGKGGRLSIYENVGDGQFKPKTLSEINAKAPGDQTAIIGWAEGDKTNIIVGSANYEQGTARVPSAFQYVLQPSGEITQKKIPGILSTTGPLAAADYDSDGDIDLFVGGRFNPGKYPESADSRLFKNENGQFYLDKVNSLKLRHIGLVTGAVFSDYDSDGDQDLFISREWGSVILFENENGIFHDISSQVGLDRYKGWWNGIATGDFNNDGRPDVVATNIGQNSSYQLDSDKPLKMYYEDFNMDNRMDIVEASFDQAMNAYVPRRHLYEFGSVSNILTHIKDNKEFAHSSVSQIFDRDFKTIPFREINTVQSMILLNSKSGFVAKPLPPEAQFSAAFSAEVGDFNNDGNEDIFLSQNFFDFAKNTPRLDAGRGLWLKGDGKGNMTPESGDQTGIRIYGEQRGAALSDFNKDGRVDLVVSQNGRETKLYLNRTIKQGIRVKLVGPRANKNAVGSNMRLIYADGHKGPVREIQAGSGYWSQNSSVQVLGTDTHPKKIRITWFDGRKQEVDIDNTKMEYVITY